MRAALLLGWMGLGWAGGAHAADWSVGAQVAGGAAVSGSGAAVAEGGVQVAVTGTLPGTAGAVRGTLELNTATPAAFSRAFVRVDATYLRPSGNWYYGVGAGSGVSLDVRTSDSGLPDALLSPVALANAHALVGWRGPGVNVEGIVRAGPTSLIGLRVLVPLR
ncbi:hypothetical protein GCM10008959_16500 [Deinococcus seoulensis]|uniref:CHRD domain-containing protein n=2 Tax=Deinococcus seoulensis TaxID=1837379 RepID=A0ABQ2RRW4_9DEIO|nr:hypothetical protein GCM10008959_16500 [Deinococcus seoulensis]